MELSPSVRFYYVWIGNHFGPALRYVYCLHGYFYTFIVEEKCVPIKTLFEMRESASPTEREKRQKRAKRKKKEEKNNTPACMYTRCGVRNIVLKFSAHVPKQNCPTYSICRLAEKIMRTISPRCLILCIVFTQVSSSSGLMMGWNSQIWFLCNLTLSVIETWRALKGVGVGEES